MTTGVSAGPFSETAQTARKHAHPPPFRRDAVDPGLGERSLCKGGKAWLIQVWVIGIPVQGRFLQDGY